MSTTLQTYLISQAEPPTLWHIADVALEYLNWISMVTAATWLLLSKDLDNHRNLIPIIYGLSGSLFFCYAVRVSLFYLVDSHYEASWVMLTAIGLAFTHHIIAGSTARGPKLYVDLKKLYNSAVTKQLEREHNSLEPNVVQASSCSIFESLSLSYVYTLIKKGVSVEQLDVHDLPAVEAHARTQNILPERSRHEYEPKVGDHPTWYLLYTIWKPEWKGMLKSGCYTNSG
jgi:hypothetical protein